MNYLTINFFKKNTQCLGVLLPLLLVGCSTMQTKTVTPDPVIHPLAVPIPQSYMMKSLTEWVIMDPPLRSPKITFSDKTTGEDVEKAWAQLKNEEIINLLSNTRSEISIIKLNGNGTFSSIVANATAGIGDYKVIMDYTPYIVEDAINPETGEKIGDARVGLGLRLTANITTYEAGVNVGSLMSLGIAAKLNQLQGTMHVDTIGIRLKNNSGMILLNTAIDETSILKTLEAMAIIQSKIADADTHLDPQVIWVKPISDDIRPEQVAQQMTKPDQPAQ